MIVPLTLELANVLAFTMREDDVREIMAMRRDEYRHEFAEECAYCGGWCCLDKDGMNAGRGWAMLGWWARMLSPATASRLPVNRKKYWQTCRIYTGYRRIARRFIRCRMLGWSGWVSAVGLFCRNWARAAKILLCLRL